MLVADAEAALGGVVKFLPLIAIPGVVAGIPYLVYKRLSQLEGEDYTETVFTDKDPPRRYDPRNKVNSKRNQDIEDLTYDELSEAFGDPGLRGDGQGRGFADPEPEEEEASPFKLPEIKLPDFKLPF